MAKSLLTVADIQWPVDLAIGFGNLKSGRRLFWRGNGNRQTLLIDDIELDPKIRMGRTITGLNYANFVGEFESGGHVLGP
ncbi:MAG: hypothetical protein L0312_19985 [Acidobacteria bacterium]|nr:hypothetical protein [Acidobacteriota bacterium]